MPTSAARDLEITIYPGRQDRQKPLEAFGQPVGGLQCLCVQPPEILEGRGAMPDGPHRHPDAVAARVGEQPGHLRSELGAGVVADHPHRQRNRIARSRARAATAEVSMSTRSAS